MGHLGKYSFPLKTYVMSFFIASYGHTVIISQMEFSLCDKYNNYVHFFKLLPWDNKSKIMLGIKSES